MLVFWKAAQWAMSSARTAREAESLTPADFEALKEACETLIADMCSTADECTARVEKAIRQAEAAVGTLHASANADKSCAPRPAVPIYHLPAGDTEIPEFTLPFEDTEIDQTAVVTPVTSDVPVLSPTGSVERIYQLAEQGISCEEIARREDRSPAEVKLFLDVREMQTRFTQAA